MIVSYTRPVPGRIVLNHLISSAYVSKSEIEMVMLDSVCQTLPKYTMHIKYTMNTTVCQVYNVYSCLPEYIKNAVYTTVD